MVGEYVVLLDISNLCQWTNTIFATLVCIPIVILALLHRLIPRRRNGLLKLEWREDYFERGFLTINQPKHDPQQKSRVEDSEKEVPSPGLGGPVQALVNKQAV